MTDTTGYNHFTETIVEETETREPEKASLSAFNDFIIYGVRNGGFAQGPDDPDSPIDATTNKLPNWSGPTVVAGGTPSCAWEAAPVSAPAGRAIAIALQNGDEVRFEQIVPIAGSSTRVAGVTSRLTAMRSGADGLIDCKVQYLDANEAATGAEVTSTYSVSSGSAKNFTLAAGLAPADACYARLRWVARANLGATTIYFLDARCDGGAGYVTLADLADPATYGYSQLLQANGVLFISSGISAITGLRIDTPLQMAERAAAPNQVSGHYIIYPKSSDSRLYGKNDAGTERQLDLTTAEIDTAIGAGAHIADSSDAHDASAISIADAAGDFTATDVEGALAELAALAGTLQPLDDELTAIAGLASAADQVPVFTGSGTAALKDYDLAGTAAVTPSFGGGSVGLTTSANTLHYRVFGDVVLWWLQLTFTAKGTSTGGFGISGLPFSPTGVTAAANVSFYSAMSGLTGAIVARTSAGLTNISIAQTGATGVSTLNDTHFTNTSILIMSGYFMK